MADFGSFLDGIIAPFAPGWAASRAVARVRLQSGLIAHGAVRQYDAAQRNRRTSGWRRDRTSADAENARARTMLAAAGHDLVRNNKYAAAMVRQLVATIWGDGIAPQFIHADKKIQQNAQDAWDRWAEGKVDDLGDWYGHGKISVREMIVGGEALTIWRPDKDGPDGKVRGLEGPQLDMSRTNMTKDGERIVQGVQFDRDGERTGYWLFDEHPDDISFGLSLASHLVAADNVDHLFERLRFRQTRGVSWTGAVAMTLRDIGDIEDARRLQEKVQACIGMVIQPGEGATASPLAEQGKTPGDNGVQPLGETMRPGMIVRLQPGETMSTITPQPSAITVDFIRQQLAAVSANMVPYHVMTGDVSQANYSGLRAAMNGSYAMVDDWQQNEVIPLLCRPAVMRRMRRLSLEKGDRRYLEVKANYALPVRRLVDPVKDLLGEIMEIRAGLKTIEKGLGERGLNTEEHLGRIAELNKLIDTLGLALDTDPRRLTDSGVLQAAAGYIRPQQGNQQD